MINFETLILRFRDLSTSLGETITKHKELIEDPERPYVWWAWWSKAGERVPSESFIRILSKIREDKKVEIFLFDSGQSLFYKATLIDIRWNIDFTRNKSPEPAKTPIYYNENGYLSWFCISKIESIEGDEILGKYSYERVDEFFESGKSIFSSFYGKIIFSSEELRHQERTIWFIRKKQDKDLIHEVMIYDSGQIFPANFPENVITAKGDAFLWLSDLHFCNSHHAFPMRDDETPYEKSLLKRIQDELEKEQVTALAGLIITGDITWKAAPDEFNDAISFIKNIKSRFSIKSDHILVCPGNHDIRFTDTPWEKNVPVGVALEEAKNSYALFYKTLFGIQPNNYLCSGKRIVTNSGFCLDIVALNSSFLHQEPGVFQGHGFVGEQQCEEVAKSMNWLTSAPNLPKTFRIVALHHHLVPVLPEVPKFTEIASTSYDASSLLDWLADHEVDIVLHGHMHHVSQTQLVREDQHNTRKYINIISMGSSGVKREHIAKNEYNTISVIKFERNFADLKVIRVSPQEPVTNERRVALETKIFYQNSL